MSEPRTYEPPRALHQARTISYLSQRSRRRKTELFIGPQGLAKARARLDELTERGCEVELQRWTGSEWVPCERDDDTP